MMIYLHKFLIEGTHMIFKKKHFLVIFYILTLMFSNQILNAEDSEHKENGEEHHEEEHGLKVDKKDLANSGITFDTVKSEKIATSIQLNGQIVPIEENTVHIIPRFPGIVKDVRKTLGQQVTVGETVAIIESNQNFQQYEVKSLTAGTITKQHITKGEFVSETSEIFEVIDLSELYVNFFAFSPDFSKIRIGQKTILKDTSNSTLEPTSISFISPIIDDATQSKLIRVKVKNHDGIFSPGAFLIGNVVIDDSQVPLTVKASALQSHEGKQVIFVKVNDVLEPRPVTIGRTDEVTTEILSGASLGEEYAIGNTFMIKAELGKGAAEHED